MIVQEELSMVAVPSMNDTHLEESLLINKLETAAGSNDIESTLATLKELLAHTSIHFSEEESMMQETKFPSYNSHKAEHDRHLSELAHIIKYFEEKRDTNAIMAYIKGNLKAWMLDHVKTMDTLMAEHFQSANP
ncbi:hemerythrin family protein [Sulfurimonas sp. NW15]|uniref:bacteriohemerythrin n=1 Tax=Sulfurimonas sp. NW15 TaxID=2922729 RepID=UPI003DA82E88